MTKSEKQQKQTRLYELCDKLTTAFSGLLFLNSKRIGGGAFISQRFTLEWSFCTCENKRKENYSQSFVVSALCVDELYR